MISVHQYRKQLEASGIFDESEVRRYAEAKAGQRSERRKSNPCPTRVCRMGGIECKYYRSCRDTCMVENKRITSMDKCPL